MVKREVRVQKSVCSLFVSKSKNHITMEIPPPAELKEQLTRYVLRHLNPLAVIGQNRLLKQNKTIKSSSNPSNGTNNAVVTLARKVVDSSSHDDKLDAFRCLYMASENKADTLQLVKRHQQHIARLLLQKKPAMSELQCLHGALNARQWKSPSYWVLLEGLPLDSLPYQVMVAYHYLVVQSALHHISGSLQSIAKGELSVGIFHSVASTFLSQSNFLQWLLRLAADPQAFQKYQRNSLKMLSGFIKVADFLCSKSPSTELATYTSFLRVKHAEISIRTGVSIGEIQFPEYSKGAAPFINDLKQACTGLNTPQVTLLTEQIENFELTSQSSTYFVESEDIYSVMSEVLSTNDGKLGKKLFCALTSLTEEDLLGDTFTKALSEFGASLLHTVSACSCLIVGKMLEFFAIAFQNLRQIPKPYLAFIDRFVLFSRKGLEHETHFQILLKAIPHVFRLLSSYMQTRRMKIMSGLCFEFGKTTKQSDAMKYAVMFALASHPPNDSPQEMQKSRKRIEYAICVMAESGAYSDALITASNYLATHFNSPDGVTCNSSLFMKALSRSIKNCPGNINLFSSSLKLSDADKTSLFESLLPFLRNDILNDELDTIVRLLESLKIEDRTSSLRCSFDAAQTFSLRLDVETYTATNPFQHLCLGGILVQRLTKPDSNVGAEINQIQRHLFEWIHSLSEASLYEMHAFSDIAASLSYFGYWSLVALLIEDLVSNKEYNIVTGRVKLSLILLHCECELSLQPEKVTGLLSSAGKIMKEMVASSLTVENNDVMQWKLLQLEYFIEMKDLDKCQSKVTEVERFISSKPEYDLTQQDGLMNLEQKLKSLFIMAHFLVLSSRVNMAFGKYTTALQNLKLGIKLLNSIVRKLEQSLCSDRTKTLILLLSSYNLAFVVSRHLGLLKDAMHHITEFKKLNDVCKFPMLNALNYFDIADYLAYSGNFDESVAQFAKGSQITDTLNLGVLRIAKRRSGIMFNIFNNTASQSTVAASTTEISRVLQGIMETNDSTEALSWRMLDGSFLQLDYSLSATPNYSSMTLNALVPDKRSMLIKTLMITKFNMNDVNHWLPEVSDHDSKVSIVPKQGVPSNIIGRKGWQEATLRLLECKNMLLRFMEGNCLEFLEVSETQDLHTMINRCIFLLSFVAVLKIEGSEELLESIYYLQDWPKHLPCRNQISVLLRPKDKQKNELLPQQVHGPDGYSSKQAKATFYLNLRELLPPTWVVVTIDICPFSGDLMLSKLGSSRRECVFFKLPFVRGPKRHATLTSFDQVMKELNLIVQESNESTKSLVTSAIKSREERRAWWKLRFGLDLRLKSLLNHVESNLIGGFASVFSSLFTVDPEYALFKESFESIWTSAVGKEAHHGLSDSIVALFYNLRPFGNQGNYDFALVDDLLQYMAEELHIFENHVSEANKSSLYKDLQVLYSSVNAVPGQADHVVLIPSTACAGFPWESMNMLRTKSVSRVPSVHMLLDMLKKHRSAMTVFDEEAKSSFYLVNPGGDLTRTQNTFHPVMKSLKGATGLCGEKPDEDYMISKLLDSDLFIYMGHGGGEQYMRSSALMKTKFERSNSNLPPGLLMGCSSGALQIHGRLEPTGNVPNWLVCGSPMVVANLWDITDKDIDAFSLAVFDKWGLCPLAQTPEQNICQAVASSRDTCTLKYLNGAAPIVHGLPLFLE